MRTLSYEGDGRIGEYIGGYDDWLRQRPEPVAKSAAPVAKPATPAPAATPAKPELDSKERRELGELPGKIEKLEAEQLTMSLKLAELYVSDPDKAVELQKKLNALEHKPTTVYGRWEDTTARRSSPYAREQGGPRNRDAAI